MRVAETRTNHRAAAKPARSDLNDLKQSAIPHLESIGIGELGEPSKRTKTAIMWGTKQSTVLNLAGPHCGRYRSWETGEHGDIISFIARARKVSIAASIRVLREYLGDHLPSAPVKTAPIKATSKTADSKVHTSIALRIWGEARPILGTLGEIYLAVVRGLDVARLDVAHALRWHARAQAVIGLMTDAITGEAIGIHRTFLNPDGSKRERKMLGRQGVIRLSPDAAVTSSLGLAEGVEDALAVLLSGWSPMWAGTSAGAIARFPVLPGIEVLTIFADPDDAGQRAAEACRDRWRETGREAAIVLPGRSS
jgi:putative DNA primase/helicase